MSTELSIIVCAKDAALTLPRMFNSLLDSPDILSEIELIVLNDGSSDNTSKIVAEYIDRFPYLKFVNRHKNWGVNATMNQGLQMVESPWFFRLDPDDALPEGTLKLLLAYAKAGDFDLLTGSRLHISVADGGVNEVNVNSTPFSWIGCGVLINSQKAKDLGGYNDLLWEEFDFYIRYLSTGASRIKILNTPIYHYYIGPMTITSNSENRRKGFEQLIDLHGVDKLRHFGYEGRDYVR